MALICDRGHRVKGQRTPRCTVRLGVGQHGPECGLTFHEEPEVTFDALCHRRGIFVDGVCSFCGSEQPVEPSEAPGGE